MKQSREEAMKHVEALATDAAEEVSSMCYYLLPRRRRKRTQNTVARQTLRKELREGVYTQEIEIDITTPAIGVEIWRRLAWKK